MCRHPLEWDAALYEKGYFYVSGKSRYEKFKMEVDYLDIWKNGRNEGINKHIGTEANSFWFAHPLYFINHLNDAGLLDKTFNPYEGYHVVFSPTGHNQAWSTLDNYSIIVTDNPGFAPTLENAVNPKLVVNGHNFATCSSPYGVRRVVGSRRHSGIDFGTQGKIDRPIISLIYGEVWARVEGVKDYGNVMVIKNRIEPKVYFLAHIANNGFRKEVGEKFEPLEEVALAGGTNHPGGVPYSIHLHLEVFLCDLAKEKALEFDIIKNFRAGRDRNLFLKQELLRGRVDPFHHNRSTLFINLDRR